MTPTHQYYAWLKIQQPEFYQELIDYARSKTEDPNNYEIYEPNYHAGRRFYEREFIEHPADAILNSYRLIIDEAHPVFTPQFINAIDVDYLAGWIAQEAEDSRVENREDRERIAACVSFYQGMLRAA